MNILVTGGAGFLGSHLVDSLVDRGHDVVVLDDLSRGEKSQISTAAKFVQGDVRLLDDWERAISQHTPEVIHHLAAVNGTKRFHDEADLVVDVNVNGTINAIKIAKRLGVRLIFYSSPEAFGEQENMPLSNSSPSVFPPAIEHQRHSYGASKHLGEILCQFAVREGLDVRIVRPYNVYGPRLKGGKNGQVVSKMLEANPIMVHGDGTQTRSLTWVADVVEGLIRVGEYELESGISFNLGSTDEISMLELAMIISKRRSVEYKFCGPNHGDSRRRIPDVATNSLIDWQAITSLKEGLDQLL